MPMPVCFQDRLKIPAIVAPLFLASGPDLVVEVCRSGLAGSFPTLNQRSTAEFVEWLNEIKNRLAEHPEAAPYGVNLVVHRSNPRLGTDLEEVVKHKVPFVITSLGAAHHVVDAVHSYGGLVFHDVINRRHAEKAAEAGVDGIIAVCAGAGGHAGRMSPFALIEEIRSFYNGAIILSGAMSNGRHIAAAQMMGADMAYLGTRFIATLEALASEENKAMLLDADASDIIYTPNISGIHANFMRQSLVASGLDPDNLPPHSELHVRAETRPWKNVWSAGHGVGSIKEIVSAAELCATLIREYNSAVTGMAAKAAPFQLKAAE